MSMSVKFVKPSEEHIQYVADNMRSEDKVEVAAFAGYSPIQALRKSVNQSDLVSVALIDDEPCAVFGLVKSCLLTGTGIPWLLGTDLIDSHKRVFVEHTKAGVEQMLDQCSRLVNYVHCDNKKSIRWLKSMGFQFGKPKPIGLRGEYFVKFFLEKSDV